jgi:hypothetical protein
MKLLRHAGSTVEELMACTAPGATFAYSILGSILLPPLSFHLILPGKDGSSPLRSRRRTVLAPILPRS